MYITNIQVVELNTLNAAFAVIQWKKHMGFYNDETCEGQHVYTLQDSETVSVSYEADEIPA